MKRFMLALVVLAAMDSTAFAESKAEREVAEADESWAEAYQACKLDVMNRLSSDDLLFIHIKCG